MFDRTLQQGLVAMALAFTAAAPAIAQEAIPTAIGTTAARPTVVGQGDKGDAVLEIQVKLDRAHFSPGEIDGAFGSNVARAVAAFQESRGLDASGRVDAATWAQLDADPVATTIEYTLTDKDVAGPFVKVPADMIDKSKLDHLGYASPLEMLAERYHASPQLLRDLNPGVDFSSAGATVKLPNVLGGAPLPSVSQVVVDKSDASVLLMDAAERVVARYPATMGSGHDPLPLGEWKITGVYKNPDFHYNPDLFWDANPKHTKATIPRGPNNPVGLVWIDLSKEHYGIHGTPEPSRIGKTQSHGCIRLTNWSVLQVAGVVREGMPAILRE